MRQIATNSTNQTTHQNLRQAAVACLFSHPAHFFPAHIPSHGPIPQAIAATPR